MKIIGQYFVRYPILAQNEVPFFTVFVGVAPVINSCLKQWFVLAKIWDTHLNALV